MKRTWLITGVSSGFGNEMTKQLLERGDTVIGTVRNTKKVEELIIKYPKTFDCRILDVTDIERIHTFIPEMFEKHGRITIVEPGGARTEFRYGSAHVANLMPEYDHVHGFLNMLDPEKGLAPGDPAKMAARMIESVDIEPAPLRQVYGSQALRATIQRLEERLADYKTQTELAASTDVTED